MGHLRTLLRKQDDGFISKRNRVGDHKITETRYTPFRRATPEMRGTKTFLESIGVPKRVTRGLKEDVMYDVFYHFTKGWRVQIANLRVKPRERKPRLLGEALT